MVRYQKSIIRIITPKIKEKKQRFLHELHSFTMHWKGGHYNEVIMSAVVSEIISLPIVYPTVYSGADQRKHQSSASLALVQGIHWWPVNSPHKGPVTLNMFPFNDGIMYCIVCCYKNLRQNDRNDTGDIWKAFFQRRHFINIQIPLTFILANAINNDQALAQAIARHRTGDALLLEPIRYIRSLWRFYATMSLRLMYYVVHCRTNSCLSLGWFSKYDISSIFTLLNHHIVVRVNVYIIDATQSLLSAQSQLRPISSLMPHICVAELWWGLLSQFSPFRYFPIFFRMMKTVVTWTISSSYLAGGSAAELRRCLANMNMIESI